MADLIFERNIVKKVTYWNKFSWLNFITRCS
jgi:hypothetical protein